MVGWSIKDQIPAYTQSESMTAIINQNWPPKNLEVVVNLLYSNESTYLGREVSLDFHPVSVSNLLTTYTSLRKSTLLCEV